MHLNQLKVPTLHVTFPDAVIEPLVDMFPVDAIVPLVVILPVDDMSHCDVHTPTPVCAQTENPPLLFINPSV